MNENEAVKSMKMYKKHLETSYSVVSDNLFKISNGSKEILASLSRVDPDECESRASRNDNDEVVAEKNSSSLPDHNEAVTRQA